MALMFRVLAVAGVAILAWAVPVLGQGVWREPARALWLGVLNPLVFMHFISGAHNDALMIGLIAAGFALVVRKHPYVGVLLITMGAAIKPIGLVALPFAGLLWAGQGAPTTLVARRWVQSCCCRNHGHGWPRGCLRYGIWLAQRGGHPGFGQTWLSRLQLLPEWPSVRWSMLADSTQLTPSFRFSACWPLSLRWHLSPISACVPALVIPRAAGLAFLALVVLGPAVQPWYLLWCLPTARGNSAHEDRNEVDDLRNCGAYAVQPR